MAEAILYLNERTAKAKVRVIGLVRNKSRAEKRFAHYKNRKDLKFIMADVSKPFWVSGKVDYIIHAASYASPKFYGKDPVGTLLPNVLGTYNILELARRKKTRGVLFFSSGEVYGDAGSKLRDLHESDCGYLDPMSPRSCYAESKRIGETMCASWWRQYKVPVKIVRPFHTYGPGMKLDDGRVFADFVADVVNNENLILNSDGKAIRSFCYISDAVKGFFAVLLKGENGQSYNVANKKATISILHLANIVADLFPEKNLRVIRKQKARPGYLKSPVKKISPNIHKIGLLGWNPKISIQEGFTRTIKSFVDSKTS